MLLSSSRRHRRGFKPVKLHSSPSFGESARSAQASQLGQHCGAMPKFNVKEVALPEFTLTPERQAALLAEVDAVVNNTLELRSAFAAGGRQLDTTAWKLRSRPRPRLTPARSDPRWTRSPV
ncbi:hypothetical protein ON010_g16608 [Phytophthora cinnamomi]|nr:hypothetical protein ON010_g16608 [Phytophthora cinnamomi]